MLLIPELSVSPVMFLRLGRLEHAPTPPGWCRWNCFAGLVGKHQRIDPAALRAAPQEGLREQTDDLSGL
jgi:hypothetical protein